MVGKKKKKAVVRPVVSLRVRPAMYEDLIREAKERRIKLSEEVERRLIHYEALEHDEAMKKVNAAIEDDMVLGDALTGPSDDTIDKLAERLAKKLKQQPEIDAPRHMTAEENPGNRGYRQNDEINRALKRAFAESEEFRSLMGRVLAQNEEIRTLMERALEAAAVGKTDKVKDRRE